MYNDYNIETFRGIDQSRNENKLDLGMTADCMNMTTEDGNLAVGYGYGKEIPTRVPGTGPDGTKVRAMHYWHTLKDDKFVVVAGSKIYAWDGSVWVQIFDYAGTLTYTEMESSGTVITTDTRGYELTPPEEWEYTDGCLIQFTCSTGPGYPEKTRLEIYINGVTYVLKKYRPYSMGEVVRVRLTDGFCEDVIDSAVHSENWDFVETRIGEWDEENEERLDKDYLLIANGETQIVKWDGSPEAGSAELFGTGSWVYEGAVEAIEYNATKALLTTYKEVTSSLVYNPTFATKVVYSLSNGIGTFTLTMPSGWTYAAGSAVSFIVPEDLNGANVIKIVVGANTHSMSYLPVWDAGDVATVTLDTTTSATESNGSTITTTGIFTLTMPSAWSYTEGCKVAFDIPKDMGTLSKCSIKIGADIYVLSFVPIWAAGDTVVVSLEGSQAALPETVTMMTWDTAATASNVKTVKLKDVPENWAYEENCKIAFAMAEATAASVTGFKVKINSIDYELNSVPTWANGDIAVVQLNAAIKSIPYVQTGATAYAYASEDYVGTYTLTMPAGWTYEYGKIVSFVLEHGAVHGSLKELKIKIDGVDYICSSVPEFEEPGEGETGKRVFFRLGRGHTATPEDSDVKYGIKKITVTPAIPDEWKRRCKDIGIRVDEYTSEVEEINEERTVITLKEPITRDVKVGAAAQIRGGVSDIHVNFMELYYNRLLSAGDPEHPSRLYWSQPPGDSRTIEDWSMDDASDVTGGGHVEVGNVSSDPIVALVALSNQLLIFKKASVWRLIGDRPANYTLYRVNKDMEETCNGGIIANGDVPYWMTGAGMYYHDGQQAHISPTARQIQKFLKTADLTKCRSCENKDRLYFSCRVGDGELNNTLIVYDMIERVYLLRNGFNLTDIRASNGRIYMINQEGYVYRWGEEFDDYDGVPIEAYWNTPFTDLSSRSTTKHLTWLYVRGEGAAVKFDFKAAQYLQHVTYYMPETEGEILRITLKPQGRAIGMKIYNEAGSWFKLHGGLTLRFEAQEDGT